MPPQAADALQSEAQGSSASRPEAYAKQHNESSHSPHSAAAVADRRLIPPLATEAPVDLKRAELSRSPPIAVVAPAGRLIPPPAANVLQSAAIEESLSHSTVCLTTPITLGAITRWESWKGRWRLRTRLPRAAAMAPALAPLPLPVLRGELQGCVLLPGDDERRHTASERAGILPPRNRKGKRQLPRSPLANAAGDH